MPDPIDLESHPALYASESRWNLFGPGHLPYRVLLLAKIIDRVTTQHVRKKADLSLAEWRVMSHVNLMGKCSASEVAGAAFVDRAEVSRAVGTLEERGLIAREPNPRNRKSSLLALTEKGHTLYTELRGERGKFFEEWLVDLNEPERAQIDDGLRKIMRRVVAAAPHAIDS